MRQIRTNSRSALRGHVRRRLRCGQSGAGLRRLPHANHGTGEDALLPALAGQVIHPYSDLPLHDMGGELADHRPQFLATGREWRTPPL